MGAGPRSPTISSPNDISYEEGAVDNNIMWTIADMNPDVYNVTLDGVLYTSDTAWINTFHSLIMGIFSHFRY